MFDVYIKNYNDSSGSYVSGETLLYSIPITDEENALVDPKVSVEMGKAGSFEFSMNVGHPYYNSLCQMKTIFRVTYDGDTIFRGRVLTVDTGHFTGVKRVHCEGDLAFLLDSQMEGVADDKRPKTDGYTYLQSVINSHNTQMAESGSTDKQFLIGEVPGNYSSAVQDDQKLNPDADYRYGSGSWRDSQSALSDLTNSFGGFIRSRYQNGSIYLDWLNNYYQTDVNTQTIEIGENLIDITSNSEVNNIFTAVVPIGSADGKSLYIDGYKTDIHGENNRILVPQITQVYTDEELNTGFHSKQDYLNAVDDYGIIYHTENFSNADTKEKLWEYACDWIKNNYNGGIDSFNISALDMHVVGESSGKFLIGDRVHVIYPDVNARKIDPEAVINKMMTVMAITYELYHPEKNQYTIGVPNGILKKNYGEKKSSKKGGGGAGGKARTDQEEKEEFESWKKYDDSLIWSFVIDAKTNSKAYQDYEREYGQKAAAAIAQTTFLAVGNEANKVPGWSHLGLVTVSTDGIKMPGVISEADKKMAETIAKVQNDLTITTRSLMREQGIAISPILPNDAINWNAQQFNKFNDFVAGEFKADSQSGSVKIITNSLKGTSSSSAGTQYPSTVTDGGKGLLTAMEQKLAGSFESMQDVLDENVLPNLDLKGSFSQITGGNGEFNFFDILGQAGNDGTSGSITMKNLVEDLGTGDLKAVTTTALDGFTGNALGIGALFGSDPTKDIMGLLTGEEEPTIQIHGPTGTQNVGKDGQGEWRVLLNDSVTYTDDEGVEHVLEPGFVTANDFKIKNVIPSFKTKTAVIDQAFIGKADVSELNALKLTVNDITASTIRAGTRVSAANIGATKITSSSAEINTLTIDTLIYRDGGGSTNMQRFSLTGIGDSAGISNTIYGYPGTNMNLAHHHSITISEQSDGRMKVQLGAATASNDSSADTAFFKIADTAAYKAGIGIKSTGSWVWSSSAGSGEGGGIRTITPNAGQSVDIELPTISATAGIVYNSKTHTYTASAVAKTLSHEVSLADTVESDLTAYNDGWQHCIDGEITSSAPEITGTLAYNQQVNVVVSAKTPDGKTTELLSRKYTAPPNGGASLQSLLTVNASTSSQTITPSSGYDGFAKVVVNAARLQNITATSNGTVTPGSSYYGIGQVTVNVPQTAAKLQTKTFTTNGTKSPDSGYDGFSKVTVNVPTAGDSITVTNMGSVKTSLAGQYSIKNGYRYTFQFKCGDVTTTRTFKGVPDS